jgi:hypothetical protein
MDYYFNAFPQDGQNRSLARTGLPHFGQNPSKLVFLDLRRALIMASSESSLT